MSRRTALGLGVVSVVVAVAGAAIALFLWQDGGKTRGSQRDVRVAARNFCGGDNAKPSCLRWVEEHLSPSDAARLLSPHVEETCFNLSREKGLVPC